MYENEKTKKVHVTFDYSWGDICVYIKEGAFLLTQKGPVLHNPGELIKEPLLQLTKEEAVDLMDGLYQQGIRPTEVGTAGQLAAMKYHLEDMRKLVFKND